MAEEEAIARLHELLPQLVLEGKFGAGLRTGDVRIKTSKTGSGHWASSTMFAEVDLIKENGGKSVKRLVVKFPPFDPAFRERVHSDEMHENECVVYTEVIPEYREFLKEQSDVLGKEGLKTLCDKLVPQCFFADYVTEKPEMSVIVLDDLRDSGFTVTTQKSHLDMSHVTQSIKLIGRYHGVSYAHQVKRPEEAARLASRIKDTRFQSHKRKSWETNLNTGSLRAIWRMLADQNSEVPSQDLEKLKGVFEDTFSLMQHILNSGDLRVLCHGDFCANNMLYHYTPSGAAESAVLIDFQTPYFSSPAVDLSFFIFINTDEHFRNQHMKEMIQLYHTTVLETMSTVLGQPIEDPRFSFEHFQRDFASHAAYGYVICGFFLPVMLQIDTEPFDLVEDTLKNETMSREERVKDLLRMGGEAATQELIKVCTEFYERGFFEFLLNDYVPDEHL